jgi:glycolate oxidase iron-sulfur subunit
MHLVDHARRRIEQTFCRPLTERALRRLLGAVLSRPAWFRPSLRAAVLAKPAARFLPRRLRPLLTLAPARVPRAPARDRPRLFLAEGARRMRAALLPGCAQQVLAPEINGATVRLLTRLGCEVVVAPGSGCCGSLVHHLGEGAAASAFARRNIDAWEGERLSAGLDAVIVNASGCGTTVKDYGFMLREDPTYADKAASIAGLAQDVTEVVGVLGLGPVAPVAEGRRVAYHSACSLQHGQRIHAQPKALLTQAGFETVEVPEGHLCCGSAGTYNLLQPEIAGQLRRRKLDNIAKTEPDLVAAGNIGCITQLAPGCDVPVVHTVELLDWATGGPIPPALQKGQRDRRRASAGISSDSAKAAPPIAVGSSQLVPPSISRPPAAPSST